MTTWWLLGGFVIVVLAVVAARYQWRLHLLRQTQSQQRQTLAQGRDERLQSIEVICRALTAQQVQPAEAGVRVAALLNQLQVDGGARTKFAAFDEMDSAVSHIPRLGAWNDLDRSTRQRYQREIDEIEVRLAPSMRAAAAQILAIGVRASLGPDAATLLN